MLILTYEDPRPNDRSDNDRTSLNQSQGLLQPPGLLLHLLDLLHLSFSLSLNLEIIGWRNQNHLFLLFHSRIFALSVRSSHVGLRGKISSFANNQPSLIDKKMFCRKPIWQRKHSQVQVLELTFLVGWLGTWLEITRRCLWVCLREKAYLQHGCDGNTKWPLDQLVLQTLLLGGKHQGWHRSGRGPCVELWYVCEETWSTTKYCALAHNMGA